MNTLCIYWMVCLQFSYMLCCAFVSMLCMHMIFMLNVWSLWEGEYEFQLFLVLIIPARSAMKVCKECVDEFWVLPHKSSGEIELFLYQQKWKYSTEPCKVCTCQVEVLEFYNQVSGWITSVVRSVQSWEISDNQRLSWRPQGVPRSLRMFDITARTKLRRDKGLESSKEGRGSKLPRRNQS